MNCDSLTFFHSSVSRSFTYYVTFLSHHFPISIFGTFSKRRKKLSFFHIEKEFIQFVFNQNSIAIIIIFAYFSLIFFAACSISIISCERERSDKDTMATANYLRCRYLAQVQSLKPNKWFFN